MKKLSTLFVLMFLATGIYAQDMMTPKYGVKAGLNLSGFIADDALSIYQDNGAARLGVNGGFFAIFPVSENFSIQPEVLYSLQGISFVDPELYVDYNYVENIFGPDYVEPDVDAYGDVVARENLHYLNVPILANIVLTEGISIQIGPQFGFLMNGTARFDTEGDANNIIENTFPDFQESVNITDQRNSFTFAASAGFQAVLPSDLMLGLRYNYGLVDVVDDEADEVNLLNQVGQFYIGYTF
ncbi:MAG: porin family protein [Cyclobacteriaceae bacterium]